MLIWKDASIRGTQYKVNIVRGEIHFYHWRGTGGDPPGEERLTNDVNLERRVYKGTRYKVSIVRGEIHCNHWRGRGGDPLLSQDGHRGDPLLSQDGHRGRSIWRRGEAKK